MASITYNDVTDSRIILGITSATMYISGGDYTVENLIKDKTSYAITNIESNHTDGGAPIIAAFKIEAVLSLYDDNLEDLRYLLQYISNNEVTSFKFTIGADSNQVNAGNIVVAIDTSNSYCYSFSARWDVLQGQKRPATTITLTAYASTNILNTATKLFTQDWST